MGDGPLVIASTDTLLLDVSHQRAEQCRAELASFAELERSPEHLHTFKITELGLWNARASGIDAMGVVDIIDRYSANPVPHSMAQSVLNIMDRYGQVVLDNLDGEGDGYVLKTVTPSVLSDLMRTPRFAQLVEHHDRTAGSAVVAHQHRGQVKWVSIDLGLPVDDRADFSPGTAHKISLSDCLELRRYQRQAIDSWAPSGSGVVVLPCGAGKTVVGLGAMAATGMQTLVLVASEESMAQWVRELVRFTNINPTDIGRFTARTKQVGPITLATYSSVSVRRDGQFRHMSLLNDNDWGLVIYDEVHLVPSSVLQMTTSIQSRRRLGLTATLVREDGKERDVFTVVGPKRFDMPWRELESQGWLASVDCHEVRVYPTEAEKLAYARASARSRPGIAALVTAKADVAEALVDRHSGESILITGTYLESLSAVAERLGAPIITGSTPNQRRLELFAGLREGAIPVLAVSKVGNHSVDLPEVSVAIQMSGTFGSRQEEAQRLGRILRPKGDGKPAAFYTLVTQDTVEVEYAARRQRFLAEQGYSYSIIDADDLI